MAEQWVTDLGGTSFAHVYRVDGVLVDERSPYQHIRVIENADFGRMLILDDAVQTSERDEFVYHEMLAHVPLVAHPEPTRVLIIGAGDGGLLEEALKHPLERAVMVEIDEMVVRVSREHLATINRGAFDDPRAELRIEDGIAYARTTDETFDVALVDSTDPKGPGLALFGEEFYGLLAQRLTAQGLAAVQSGSPLYQQDVIRRVRRGMRQHFPLVRTYTATVPTYPGVIWTFTIGSKGPDPAALGPRELSDRIARFDLQYYSPAIHQAAFVPPEFIARVWEDEEA